jgi:hypothetical protein
MSRHELRVKEVEVGAGIDENGVMNFRCTKLESSGEMKFALGTVEGAGGPRYVGDLINTSFQRSSNSCLWKF